MAQVIGRKLNNLVSDMIIVGMLLTTILSFVANHIENKYVIAVFSGIFVVTGILGLVDNNLFNREQ